MSKSRFFCIVAALLLLTGCQDKYVHPSYTLADLIGQVQKHHADIVTRSKETSAEKPSESGMLHHSLHEIDATLGAIMEYPADQLELETDQVAALRGVSSKLRKAYRDLDDEFHQHYEIDFSMHEDCIQKSLDRLTEFR
ncbi:MAG: hypothetical protein AAF497_05095 [Planctomycetota bacterium]